MRSVASSLRTRLAPTPAFRPSCRPSLFARGKKTTTLAAKDLPQGLIGGPPLEDLGEDAGPAYPTLLQQVRNNMRKFDHCVLLTRVGNFYEMYFEHAEEYGPLLNLKVSLRRSRPGLGPVPMAGFPYFQLDRFLKILVQDLNKYVAISDEVRNDPSSKLKSGGLLFDRKVSRIITPGTLVDEKFIDPWENNYCLAIHVVPAGASDYASDKVDAQSADIGLAWLDMSSGEFFTQSTTITGLSSALALIRPREVVLHSALEELADSRLVNILEEDRHVITFHQPEPGSNVPDKHGQVLQNAVPGCNPSAFPLPELGAAAFLLEYVRAQLQGSSIALQPPVRREATEFMSIDKNTLRALELRTTLREGKLEGSLLHSIRKTVTKSGARLLTQRLTSPSMSLDIINERLDLVAGLIENVALRQNLVALLRRTFDTWRLVQKFSIGRGDADDLLELSKTIQITKDVAQLLENETGCKASFEGLVRRLSLDGPGRLSKRILDAIDEDGLSEQHRIEDDEAAAMAGLAAEVLTEEGEEVKSGNLARLSKAKQNGRLGGSKAVDTGLPDVWIMRCSASATLARLHEELDEIAQQKDDLSVRLREATGAPGLSLRWTPGLGHIVHIKGKSGSIANLESARSVSSSKSTRSYHVPEWTKLGNQLDEARLRIRSEEQRVFGQLRAAVVRNLVKLRRNAAVLDELDVACSFATLAEERGLVRPKLNHGTTHKIVGGRHPVVETGLLEQGRNFTSNSCNVGDGKRILLITGHVSPHTSRSPNMAGKSTFLRQNALISILAQTGSFVPAEYAEIGLVDKIFSRVGSADNLYQDQSTFMVEMLETAEILKQATPRSFVIMDEVGRGTTPEDGIAVGYACLHHLYHVNRCRALFATHFHRLADMTEDFEQLECYCTDVEEGEDGAFAYVHRLRKGINRKSHALKVARVAGLPNEAITVAARVLKDFKMLPHD
ncbi:muts domain V-domain-containing protein [Macrophomina phaseolina]|uniref:Muts domain V-domain-containing protein n=1 Tax=Macrophomina phaseolina TaxID=35725 RepID=A0ABQ8GM97_9PEZI|nr:muts domain V-domain-containing protein [Macrophomina phaseolina]